MDLEELIKYAKEEIGFSHAGALNVEALEFLPSVREMCAADRCRSYGRTWTCPPACGSLEEAAARARAYKQGILVQSTGQMEDDFDVDCMMDTEEDQKERFEALVKKVREDYPDCLPMACGACRICDKCSYPDGPCRFPERAIPSMEAYGLFVSKVCTDSGMEYNYGKQTITFTCCILF